MMKDVRGFGALNVPSTFWLVAGFICGGNPPNPRDYVGNVGGLLEEFWLVSEKQSDLAGTAFKATNPAHSLSRHLAPR
jgi:hypothetical protein